MGSNRRCFVVMPFRADLHFFYLYLRHHLHEHHNLEVERADHRILTVPLMDKIRDSIRKADVIVGDMTERNPNVFYELGLADAFGKPVILMTQDSAEKVPADVRHLEFIQYELTKDTEFLARMDNAISNVFANLYREPFERAKRWLSVFQSDSKTTFKDISFEEFQRRVVQMEKAESIPATTDDYGSAKLLVPKILKDPSDHKFLELFAAWISSRIPCDERH